VLIAGNGYGHGVGLCQEGAMKMAEVGYSFDKILRYYYTNIHLIDLSLLDFFKD
jgi:stage II sporulation protein D